MKTITIPKRFGYPSTKIVINGATYSLKSGEGISVDDALAEVIENALALEPKAKPMVSVIGMIAEQSLTEITAEDLAGISTISACAFYSCKSLLELTIPDGITSIGNNAFDWCENLKKIYLPEVPPLITNSNVFGTVNYADRTFYFKSQSSMDAYLSTAPWDAVAAHANFAVK